MKKEFLSEERYQQSEKKIKKIALIILIVGVSLGLCLILIGIVKQMQINSQYSDKNKALYIEKLEKEKEIIEKNLELEKQQVITYQEEIENKIKPIEDEIKKLKRTKFTGFDDAYYERQDKIEELEESIEADKKSLSVIEDVLDDGFNDCSFSTAKNNQYTSKYCSVKNSLSEKKYDISIIDSTFSEFNKSRESHKITPFYMFGAFIIITSLMISGTVYMTAKRRDILAFSAQQVMPLAQEGIEKMAPTIGRAGSSIAKELSKGLAESMDNIAPSLGKAGANLAKEMAPAYGAMAKEISKGIKEGLKEEEQKEKKANKKDVIDK